MIKPIVRHFISSDFDANDSHQIEALVQDLKSMPVDSKEELLGLLDRLSEAEAVVGEAAAWMQIRLTTDTSNETYEKEFTHFVTEIEPVLKQGLFEVMQKITTHPDFAELKLGLHMPYLRAMEGSVAIFRPENIALQSEESLLAQKYGSIAAQMSIEFEGKEYTLQQAAKLLESKDRSQREKVYHLIQERRMQDSKELFELFFKLRSLRHQIALNAGFENYRDYKFAELGRYDYTPEDCFLFHDNVKKHFLPIWNALLENRKKDLGYDRLNPWDVDAPAEDENELKPFEDGKDLQDKTIALFAAMDPYFGSSIQTMKDMQRLDLDSRKSKAPGGYNCPLPETGVPFIFMNAAGTSDDLITMMHESGHAFHSFLSHDLPWSGDKEYPMEIAELASMSMELMTMDRWDMFYSNPEDLKMAKYKELERVISVLPWVATIDKFQHWIYTHPESTEEELSAAWMEIHNEFSAESVDWSGLEKYRRNIWQKQLHLFEVPFYYIEYGIAQIGAVAVWRAYLNNPQATLDKYKEALSKGYTQTLPELYKTAGISLDMSESNLKQLADFLTERLNDFK